MSSRYVQRRAIHTLFRGVHLRADHGFMVPRRQRIKPVGIVNLWFLSSASFAYLRASRSIAGYINDEALDPGIRMLI